MRQVFQTRETNRRREATQYANEAKENFVLYKEGFQVFTISQSDALTRGIDYYEVVPPGNVDA